MRLVRKYRVADDVDKLSPVLKGMANLERFAKATGNQSLGRLAEETYKTCAAMKGVDKETAAALVVEVVQMLKQLSTASNRGVFEDVVSAQLERNYNAALDAVKSSLTDYLKARRINVKGDADSELEKANEELTNFIWKSGTMKRLDKAINNISDMAKRQKILSKMTDFLRVWGEFSIAIREASK